jgi:hypothetical protein
LFEPPLNDLATPHLPTLVNRRTWHLAAIQTAAKCFFELPPLACFHVVIGLRSESCLGDIYFDIYFHCSTYLQRLCYIVYFFTDPCLAETWLIT